MVPDVPSRNGAADIFDVFMRRPHADIPSSDNGIELVLWGNAESAVTIVAASVPVLRVLIRDVRSTVAGRRAGRNGRANGAGHNGADGSRYFDWTEAFHGGNGSGASKEKVHKVKSKRVRMRSHSHNNTVEVVTQVAHHSGKAGNIMGLAGLSTTSSRGGTEKPVSGSADDRSDRSILVEEQTHAVIPAQIPGSPGSMSDGSGGFGFGGAHGGAGGGSGVPPGTAITKDSPREGGDKVVRPSSIHPEGGIIQTRDVTIEYHERRESDAYDPARLPV